MAKRRRRKARKITAHQRHFGAVAKRCERQLSSNFSFKKLGACMKKGL